jgi:hypothetical protein
MFRKTIKLVLILLFFSCKSENKLDTQTSSPKLILSEIIKSDSLNIIKFSSKSLKMIADWTPLISINSKINKISIHSNDHVSIINSIKIDLQEIHKNNIPFPFNIPDVIGRIRVFKTYVYKMNSYEINIKNLEVYGDDFNKMVDSYNALIGRINTISSENEN